jgi:hypothetical protein
VRTLMLLALLLLPLTLSAEFEFDVQGHLNESADRPAARRGPAAVEGATVSFEADRLWGFESEQALEEYEQEHGLLPRIDIEGSAMSDAGGRLSARVSVRAVGDGRLPTRESRLGAQGKVQWCALIMVVRREGFRELRTPFTAEPDQTIRFGVLDMRRSVSLRFQVAEHGTNRPLEGIEFRIRPLSAMEGRSPQWPAATAVSAANGQVLFGEDICPPGFSRLEIVTPGFAWVGQQTWYLTLSAGETNLGTRLLQSSMELRFRVVCAETGDALAASAFLTAPSARVHRAEHVSADGNFVLSPIPRAEHTMELRPTIPFDRRGAASHSRFSRGPHQAPDRVNFWPRNVTFSPEDDKAELDLGDIIVQPKLVLKVIAETPEGTGIDVYGAHIELIEGEPPAPINISQQTPTQRHANLNAEERYIHGLFRGRWRLTVTAQGYAAGSTELELPTAQVVVRLAHAGRIAATEVHEPDNPEFQRVYALRDGSPALAEYDAWADDADSRRHSRRPVWTDSRPHHGLYVAARDDQGIWHWRDLPVGRYVVVVPASRFGSLRLEDVVVEAGSATEVELKPRPSVLNIHVTRGAIPAPGEAVYVYDLAMQGRESVLTEHVTDAEGRVRLEVFMVTTFVVLDQHAQDMVSEAPDPQRLTWWLNELGDAQVRLGIVNPFESRPRPSSSDPTDHTFHLELEDREHVWLRVELDGVSRARDVSLSDRLRTMPHLYTGTTFHFPRVPPGTYTLRGRMEIGSLAPFSLSTHIEVGGGPVQSVTIPMVLHAVTVTLNLPSGVEAGSGVDAQLFHPSLDGLPSHSVARAQLRQDGTLHFHQVLEGDYILHVTLPQSNSVKHVRVSGPTEATVSLVDGYSALHLTCTSRFAAGRIARIELEDADGNPADLQVPEQGLVRLDHNRRATIRDVPPGTWNVRVSLQGYQPILLSDVQFEAENTTALSFEAEDAIVCYLSVSRARAPHNAATVRWIAYDSDGNVLQDSDHDPLLLGLREASSRRARYWIFNVHPEAAEVHIVVDGLPAHVLRPDEDGAGLANREVELRGDR